MVNWVGGYRLSIIFLNGGRSCHGAVVGDTVGAWRSGWFMEILSRFLEILSRF